MATTNPKGQAMGSTGAKVGKGASETTPGLSNKGSNFAQAPVTLVNAAKGHGGAAGSGSYPGGKGAIGNSAGIPSGADA